MIPVSYGRKRRRREIIGYVLCGFILFFLISLHSSKERPNIQMTVAALVTDGMTTEEMYRDVEKILSPSNARAQCSSIIYPGGKCQCVDALEDIDKDNCMPVPVLDGKKTVCLDILPPGKPCLVYSFGIKDDLSFELEMAKFGCTVHAFDPTIKGDGSVHADAGVHVHHIGIDGRSWTARTEQFGTVSLMTLDDLVRHLGHEGRRIDYLKLDVEGSEWDILRDQLIDRLGDSGGTLGRIPQMTIEFHLLFPRGTIRDGEKKQLILPERADAQRFLKSLRALEAAGFEMLESRPDPGKYKHTNISFLYETTWMKV